MLENKYGEKKKLNMTSFLSDGDLTLSLQLRPYNNGITVEVWPNYIAGSCSEGGGRTVGALPVLMMSAEPSMLPVVV